jgi:transposase
MTDPQTIEAFRGDRAAYKRALLKAEAELKADWEDLREVLFDRPYTDEEKRRLEAIRAALGEVQRNYFYLVQADIREFDRQDRVRELKASFEDQAASLNSRAQELRQVAATLESIESAISAVEKAVGQLGKLLV